jgi:hypothetical protein
MTWGLEVSFFALLGYPAQSSSMLLAAACCRTLYNTCNLIRVCDQRTSVVCLQQGAGHIIIICIAE